jgi:hypothetical protein
MDYASIESADVANTLTVRAARTGTVHGIAMWFDSALGNAITLSNAPGEPPLIFGQAFLPWPEPVAIRDGDLIELDIRAKSLRDGYLWRWNSRVVSDGRERAAFRQSQFDALLLVPEKLRRQAATHVPKLNQEGEIERFALDCIAQGRPLGKIADDLRDRFPARFAQWQDALNHVGSLALRCSD